MIMFSKVASKKRVLIVDDDLAVTQMLTMVLQIRGYEVIIAGSGSEAIDMAASDNLDLILLDLVLPDLEGFEVCRRLKEEKKTNHIPIIILSARYLYEDKVEGLYLGADDYLTKPFDQEELVARMDAVIRRRSLVVPKTLDGSDLMVSELRKIIKQETLESFFQPIYFLKPFRLFGLEVLSRVLAPSPLANPEVLFNLALRFGLYSELEMLAWRKALRTIRPLLRDEKVFLNCNPYFIEGPKFLDIQNIFDDSGVSTNNIILEITERSEISDFKIFYESVQRFRDRGFWLAVDDVGGGYASFESIVEIKPEIVKIDHHLVSSIHQDQFKRSVVKCVVNFCRENNIISIVEGIETKEDLQVALDLGVDAVQGYLLYRPTNALDLTDMRSKDVGL